MGDWIKRVVNYLKETKDLNRAYYKQVDFENNMQEQRHHQTLALKKTESNPLRICILIDSRINKSCESNEILLRKSNIIEEKMLFYRYLPFQICDCSYIGDGVAWAGYNLNNKRVLQVAINQINYFLEDIKFLDETVPEIIPTDYYIDFNSICFGGPYCYGLPRSYILYTPETKSGKKAQYPLTAFFNTSKGTESYADEFYLGELHYAINGELAKARVHCHKHGKFAEFIFSVVGRTFLISKIKALGKDGKPFTLYDCTWEFTDYMDFA